MVLEAFGQALQNFASPELWIFITLGVVAGLVIGVIPGLGGMLGMALALPFVLFMPPSQGLALMVALAAVTATGGAITSILLNVPGTSANAATIIDGYPMSQKGEAGRAIGAALTSSAIGGMLSVFFALAMIPVLLPMVFAVRSPDMVFLTLLGIAFIGVLGRGSMIKGLASGVLGLVISLVGIQIVTGAPRLTFGWVYLFEGIPLTAVVLGLFALPETIVLAVTGGTIARVHVAGRATQGVWQGTKDVYRHWGLFLRSSIIGYVIGVIPGIGATSATFIAYAQAKQTSKNPDEFGTGRVEGVIAPESANNAKEAGALLTTLALGIPGSADAALLLGAMVVLGIAPGPQMITDRLDLSLTLFLILIAANLMAGGICFALASRVSKIALIPSHILVPLVLVVLFVGVFASRQQFEDVIVLLMFGVLGLAMKEFGYNRPALLLGFVLGRLFEKYLFLALKVAGPLFFIRPISLILILMIIGVIGYDPMKNWYRHRFRKGVKEGWSEEVASTS